MTRIKVLIFDELPSQSSVGISNDYILKHISKIKNDAYRASSSIAYSLLGSMLQEVFGISINDVTFTENVHGKPIICDTDIYFNISHSANAVMCAVSDHEVGVDIEKICDIRDAIVKRCFSAYEKDQVSSAEDFYRIWTLKEAYLKAIGTGIDRKLDSLSLDLGDTVTCTDNGVAVPYHFCSVISNGFAVSVCSEDNISSENIMITIK